MFAKDYIFNLLFLRFVMCYGSVNNLDNSCLLFNNNAILCNGLKTQFPVILSILIKFLFQNWNRHLVASDKVKWENVPIKENSTTLKNNAECFT